MILTQEPQSGDGIDLLTATVADLRQMFATGEVRSVDLVKNYLGHIERHNHKGMNLNAVISTAPEEDIVARAQELDQERAAGHARGPMHGIPVIIKVRELQAPNVNVANTLSRTRSIRILLLVWTLPAAHML